MHIVSAKLGQADPGDNEAKLMTKLAPEWVRTSDPVIRSPARYRWTTAPAKNLYGDIAFKIFGGYIKYRHECSLGVSPVIDNIFYVASDTSPSSDNYLWRYCILKIWGSVVWLRTQLFYCSESVKCQ